MILFDILGVTILCLGMFALGCFVTAHHPLDKLTAVGSILMFVFTVTILVMTIQA